MSQDIKDASTKEIEGVTYTVMHLDPLVAQDLLVDLARVLSPAFGGAVTLMTSEGVKSLADAVGEYGFDTIAASQHDGEVFGNAVAKLFNRLDKQVLNSLRDELAKVTLVEGKQLSQIINQHFRGRLGAMFKWMAFAFQVNFAPMVKGLGGAISGALRPLAERLGSQSPDTSAGIG